MGLPRSTYYDAPLVETDDAEIVANITVTRPTPSCTLPATFLTEPSTRFSSIAASSPATLTNRCVNYARPYQLECPHLTASANNGLRPVSSAIRFTATVPSFAASLPSAAD